MAQDSPAGFESEAPPKPTHDGWHERHVQAEDGTRLYVRERPSDAPLCAVLCDGIACDGFIWRYLANDLAPTARVVHWNYRGHGRSAAPADPDRLDMGALVGDLNAVRHGHGTEPTILLGHSMGCQVALEGYRSQPDHLVGLVLLCGAPGRITHTFKWSEALAQALPRLIERVRRRPRVARALVSNFPPEVATRIALATGEVDATAIQPADLTAYTEHVANIDLLMFLRMLQAVGEQTAEDMLPTVEIPVLIITGELDTFTPPHLAERMAAALPQSELMIVEAATHVVPIERREQVRDRIQAFLKDRVMPQVGTAP
ncbi:MAG: alpha/beta hydrolase [Deltaproteobacteria bacterium]|nr:alpha/beta hydrolase [Deltaproteobacteria bacterium]